MLQLAVQNPQLFQSIITKIYRTMPLAGETTRMEKRQEVYVDGDEDGEGDEEGDEDGEGDE